MISERRYVNKPYNVTPRGGGQGFPIRTITGLLLALNIGVFFLDRLIFNGVITKLGVFSWNQLMSGEVWRVLTCGFLHANFSHLLVNMLGLYFFGPLVERYLGPKRYVALVMGAVFSGVVGYLLLWRLGLFPASGKTALLGFSAANFAILAVAAKIAPRATVLMFFVIPMRLKTVVWLMLAYSAYTVLFRGNQYGSNAGGEAAHLAGAVWGFAAVAYPFLTQWAMKLRKPLGMSMPQFSVQDEQEEVDRILKKISLHGMNSLTNKERQFLSDASKKD